MYLYVAKEQGLNRVPEALLAQFGATESAMVLLLEPGKKLARADAEKVLSAIETDGFYLQLPPGDQEEYMQKIHQKNSKF